MKVELTKDEIKELGKNEEIIRTNLLSRAIYAESLEYEFSKEELKELWFLTENNILGLYMQNKVQPRVMINEDRIAEVYKENKEYFDTNNINFENARNIILERLTEEQNQTLFFDLVEKLINEMGDNISLSKEDILYTKGNPNLIKSILLISVLRENAKKDGFLEEFKEKIELAEKDTKLNYYLNLYLSKKVVVTKEEVIDKMQEIQKTNFEEVKSYSQEELYQSVGNLLVNEKANEIRNELFETLIKKYDIEKKVKEYIK